MGWGEESIDFARKERVHGIEVNRLLIRPSFERVEEMGVYEGKKKKRARAVRFPVFIENGDDEVRDGLDVVFISSNKNSFEFTKIAHK